MDMSSIQHMEKLLKADTKGEYEIGEMLGRGGMAMVYQAEEVHLSRKVAIKVLPPELTFGHGVERFKREAKTAAGLDHPNIIPIYRIASGGNVFWYAMKFLEGQSLDEMLKEKGRCSLEETIQILMPVADALDYGHLHSVIHRDIKPANIMLDAQNRVTVTDFGIAKALTEGTLTASGSVIGTPFYMSPEQGMGKPVTGAADQYSVAVMTYRMLSGQVPFEGDSAIEILHKHCSILPPPLDELCPGLPDYVYKAVEKGLSKKPAQRFSTVKSFVKALKEPSPELAVSDAATVAVDSDPSIMGDLPTEVMAAADTPRPDTPTTASKATRPPLTPPRQAPKKSGVWKVLIPLIVILAAGGGGGAWWWLTQQPESNSGDGQTQSAQTDPASGEQGSIALPGDPATGAAVESTVAEPPPPAPASVAVTGMLPSGLVIVDGVAQSSQEFELTPGEPHVIVMRQAGYETITDTVTFEAGQQVRYPYVGRSTARPTQTATPTRQPTQQRPAAPRTGVVQIRVRPWSDVFIGSEEFPQTARVVDTLVAGQPHTIRFRRDGYVPKDTIVTIQPGETVRINIALQQGGL
jgi:serine/threonine protein kinase